MFLKIFQILRKTPVLETPTQVLYCKFCETFQSTSGWLLLCRATVNKSFLTPFITSMSFIELTGKFSEEVVHRCSVKMLLLKISQSSKENVCARVFFNETAGVPTTSLKKRLWHRRFPVNFAKFFKNTFFYRTPLVAKNS